MSADQKRKERERQTNFIDYVPKDVHSEGGLAVDRTSNPNGCNFDAQARQISIDISADDDVGMYKEQKRKRWFETGFCYINFTIKNFRDRKLKKFVGADSGSGPAVKKIRTEEGTILPATYRSGRYNKWQQQHKSAYQDEDFDEGGGGGRGKQMFSFKQKRRGSHQGWLGFSLNLKLIPYYILKLII